MSGRGTKIEKSGQSRQNRDGWQPCCKAYYIKILFAILNPPSRMVQIWLQICDQQPQKPPYTKFEVNQLDFGKFCLPYCIRHLELLKSDLILLINNHKTTLYQIWRGLVDFQNPRTTNQIWQTCYLKMAITFERNIVRYYSRAHFEGEE